MCDHVPRRVHGECRRGGIGIRACLRSTFPKGLRVRVSSSAHFMQTEFEAAFLKIDKAEIRARLEKVSAKLIYPETLLQRDVFDPPLPIKGGWLRVRREANGVTMSLKVVEGNRIEDQKEVELKIDNYEQGVEFLKSIGAIHKSYQETKRELWRLNNVDITIDTWPGLLPLVEIEGESELLVKQVADILGFDYSNAHFGAVDVVYEAELGISKGTINSLPIITFENPPKKL